MGRLPFVTLGLWALATFFSQPSHALFGCKNYTRQYCKNNLRVLELKREMKVFHWFSTQHYSSQETADDYIQQSFAAFLKSGQGAAGTGGLYAATEPVTTCAYSGAAFAEGENPPDRNLARLAVVTLPVGTRVAWKPKSMPWYNPPFICNKYFTLTTQGKECLRDNGLPVFAYDYPEHFNEGRERDAFGGETVAFTLGLDAVAQKGASVKIYTIDDLLRRDSIEAAAIAQSFKSSYCPNLGLKKISEDPRYKSEEIKTWLKEKTLGNAGSRDFFSFKEPVTSPGSKPGDPSIVPSENPESPSH